MKDWSKQTVVQLKAELKRRGLALAGLKQELVTRLSEDDATAASAESEAEGSELEPAENIESQPVKPAEPSATAADETSKEVTSNETEPATAPSEAALPSPERGDEFAAPTDSNKQDYPAALLKTEASTESAPLAPVEIAQDAQKRKRRSGSPIQPSEEVFRKRLKADLEEDTQSSKPSGVTEIISKIKDGLENNTSLAVDIAKDAKDNSENVVERKSEQMIEDSLPKETKEETADVEMTTQEEEAPGKSTETIHSREIATEDSKDASETARQHDQADSAQHSVEPDQQTSRAQNVDDVMEVEREVQPAIHPATRALYIKNFMRPLREDAVLAHLLELATLNGVDSSEDDIEDLFVDRIKTHAFVVFRTTSQASRVRNALHDVIWPDERERKPLWVDFVPPEKVADWIDEEKTQGGGRGSTRWEVNFDREDDGFVVARLNSGAAPPPAISQPEPARYIPSGPAVKDVNSIPLGPRAGRGTDGVPLVPRGDPPRGPSGRPPRQIPDFPGGNAQTTRQNPPIAFQPVSEDLADRRIRNMRSFYTQDLKRDMGPESDINRYTFEQGDSFVDRGHENFVGIRPPHRERDAYRRRDRGGGGGGGGLRGPPPGRGRRNGNRRAPRPLSDRYLPGINESGPYRQGDRGNFGGRGDDRDRRF